MQYRIDNLTVASHSPPASRLRAADADRDATLAQLSDAYAQGRITSEEHAQRADAACRARTHGELAQLLADLPARPNWARVHHLADELLAEAAHLGISRGELAGLLALRS